MPDLGLKARLLNKGKGLPHKRQDTVSLKVDGEHYCYTCYHHLFKSISILECDYPESTVDIFGVNKEHDKGIHCWMEVSR